ncbi:dihydroxy-acid dehydratase [Paenibacillus montanisoli]|uniref:Dihydroxy-acid dehydratase n=1 Tax=Paenibacillus montanisoli TaxID=2081970 RepID=A0A328U0P1_9BACL|nr:dihydroxy-acid dehydratase [Paenibacillus montanisoli]RAP73546.1 dihydroxy-acid dehydratase [Paenibacillus montanisoli]
MKLRSEAWFDHPSAETRFQHRSAMRSNGHVPDSFVGKPVIGIFNSWNDLNSCNMPHKELVEYVKRGILLAGGYPLEMHTITTPSDFMKPSDLPYRNLMAMDVEEQIRSLPLDGVVLLCECDKTTPAQLMGAASSRLPALMLAAGHRASGSFRGKPVHYGTDLWTYMDEYAAGKLSDEDVRELEQCMSCSRGGCPVMGTASTMKSLAEMLGVMLPGTSTIPASHSSRKIAAEETGKRIVEMVREGLTVDKLLTERAFDNAIRLLAALGGSTNAVIHLTAIAGRLGIRIPLERYAELSKGVPLLVDLQPSGRYGMDDFFDAGGLPAVIRELLPWLHGESLTALGTTIQEAYAKSPRHTDVIVSPERPVSAVSGIAVLKGNLAPDGAVLKLSASKLRDRHRGRALVFDDYELMLDQLADESLDVDADTVLILRNCGPIGAGMPEWGAIPIPRKLLREGVRDMVRISDARMSGTSYGTVILHVSPEAAAGGPLALVHTGDWIEIEIGEGRLTLAISDEELTERKKAWKPADAKHKRGYPRLFNDTVLQAHEGCDLSFLRPADDTEVRFVPPVVGRG